MLHTNLKGEINWKDGDDIEVQIAGTFTKENLLFLKMHLRILLKMLNHIILIMRKRFY